MSEILKRLIDNLHYANNDFDGFITLCGLGDFRDCLNEILLIEELEQYDLKLTLLKYINLIESKYIQGDQYNTKEFVKGALEDTIKIVHSLYYVVESDKEFDGLSRLRQSLNDRDYRKAEDIVNELIIKFSSKTFDLGLIRNAIRLLDNSESDKAKINYIETIIANIETKIVYI